MKDIHSPIWLDIETGGVKSSESSILSIASGQGRDIRSVFAPPVAGTFLSSFSEQQIIPQLRGKSLLSEKQSIESLIQQLKENPRAPLAGFNIRGFDIGFIQRRARNYGLEKEFISTMKGRSIIDPAYHVKDIISSAIVSHTDRGTFKELLSGKTWSEAEDLFKNLPFEQRPTEYNLLAQVRGYQEASSQTAKFKGWKLEDVYKLLPEEGKLVGQAHEASTDIMMTQRVARAVQSGELERELLKPEKALQWMETVKARGYHQFGPGRLLAQADIDKMGFGLPRWWQTKTARRAGIAALSIAGIAALSRFSGRDDSYNSIEGLPHGGFAQSGRLQLTDFGSGFQKAMGMPGRLLQTGITGLKEIASSAIHISREIASDALRHRSTLAQVAFGLGILDTANIAAGAITSGLSFGTIAAAAGGFTALKTGYKALKHRRELANTAIIATRHPEFAITATRSTYQILSNQVKDYVLHGKQNPIAAFIELGGGRLGREAVKGELELLTKTKIKANIVEGFNHQGIAAEIRKLFGFSSPANTGMITGIASKIMDIGKTTRRAERLYKSGIRALLKEQGYSGKINWLSHIDEDTGEMVLAARNMKGERLMGVQRTFQKENVDLTSIEVDPSLRGGVGRKFYEYENRILKRLGFEGAEVTSPVANPITGRMQAELYGSRAMPMFARDIEEAYGIGQDEFHQMLMAKKMNKAQWEVLGFAPTFKGRVSAPRVRPIMSGKDDAHNTIEGMGHRGIGQRLRKLLTPFGSGWDALRGLVKGAETFQDMISSAGFQKALSSAVEVKQLGKGAMGTASLMKATFRDREFQFVRKTGVLGVDEVSSMKALQNKFAPTVYSSSEKHIDMELFQGKTASELIREGKLTSKNVQDIEKTARQMHRADISHGDFHAKNIMITPEGNVGPIDFGAAGPIGSSGLTPLANDQGQIIQGYYGGYTRVARKQHGKWVPEAIEIRDAEYDWGRIEQMKERIAKMKLQQARQLPATSIMPASISTETATINENTFYAATKKVRHADLQKSATKTAWEAGKNGSRRSKL